MKFKIKSKTVKKSKIKKSKFPNIYRSITESFKNLFLRLDRKNVFRIYSKTLKVFTMFVFVVAIIVLGYDLHKNIQDKRKIDFERDKIIKEINFWNSFLAKHEGYRDGYLRLSILEYKLRDLNMAKYYLRKALAIDPNFEKGRELEKVLGNK